MELDFDEQDIRRLIETLRTVREESESGGGADRIEKQHTKGKLTAHERIDRLVDDDSFVEIDPFVEHECRDFGMEANRYPGDSVVTGYGTIDGRRVLVYAFDFTVLGGSLGRATARKINKVQEKAVENGVPIVGLNDSGGARIQEGIDSLHGFANIFRHNTRASGVVPQISCIMGPCAGGAVYSPALTDFTFMVDDTSYMMITGPTVVEEVTGEQVTMDELGGPGVHASTSGVAHTVYRSDEDALTAIRSLLSYLPSNNIQRPPRVDTGDNPGRRDDELNDLVPANPKKSYDVKAVIERVIDVGTFFEIHGAYARNVVTGFARLDGRSVGIVANQPNVYAGTLDIDASIKAARFVQFCDAFNLPIVTFVDVPGFLPGVEQERRGIINHGAKLIHAYAAATVPLLTVTLRKAYGGAYIVMASKGLGADANYAWPQAEFAVMGPRGAVNVLYRREIASAEDPVSKRDELIDEYRKKFATPHQAAKRGYIDDIIEPIATRPRLIRDLEFYERKNQESLPKKHANRPT